MRELREHVKDLIKLGDPKHNLAIEKHKIYIREQMDDYLGLAKAA